MDILSKIKNEIKILKYKPNSPEIATQLKSMAINDMVAIKYGIEPEDSIVGEESLDNELKAEYATIMEMYTKAN